MKNNTKNKYVVIMPAATMLEGANAFINALDYYDNQVDFHLMCYEKERYYAEQVQKIPNFKVNLIFHSFEECAKLYPYVSQGSVKPSTMSLAEYYRWKLAVDIGPDYDAILMMDADTLLLNNIMKYFEIAAKTDLILQPKNFGGRKIEEVMNGKYISEMRGTGSPSVRNTPMFLNAKIYRDFLSEVSNELLTGGGDLAAMFRTQIKQKLLDKILILPNLLWDMKWIDSCLIKKGNIESKTHLMIYREERMNMVHDKWWRPDVCCRAESSKDVNLAISNIKILWEMYRFFNTELKVKLKDYNSPWYK